MITRIEIISSIPDTRAEVRKRKINNLGLGKPISYVSIVDVYTIQKKFTYKQLERIANCLSNPVTQNVSFTNALEPRTFTYAMEIGFLPGVTDNVANTAKELIEDLLQNPFVKDEGIYSSQVTFVNGVFSDNEALEIANLFYNPAIQRVRLKNVEQFNKDNGMQVYIPRVQLDTSVRVDTVNLNVSNEELMEIGKKGIENTDGSRRGPLALDLLYMETIRNHFNNLKRNPTDIELESIAQTWSEHCKHTIFADPIDEIKQGLYKTYIKAATEKIRKKKGKKDICMSVFTDNSGAIIFDDNYLITDKVETHNSPSALDPFGGAITGIVGVNRDAIGFGIGAKPVINRYGFCFADPNDTSALYKGEYYNQKMLSPRRIMDGVIDGVNSGGNCSGIPTPQGFMYFDSRYKGKPLVFVGTVGLIPRKVNGKESYKKKASAGEYIVMVGGRVGLDGIHGATFSSEAMDSGSPATAVQIGDPITQKKLSDAIVKEARDLGLYTSITDNGAGGLSCSIAEMAKESGGCSVDLDKVPVKYPGLAPWQIWISESQERMTLAVPEEKWSKFSELMQKRGVEATIVGVFTDSGKCQVQYNKKIVMDLDMEFLHNGLPPRPMTTTYKTQSHPQPKIREKKDLSSTLLHMLSRLNITSYEFVSSQYDHEVQSGSVLKPLQGRGRVNADTTVTRPVLSSKKGIVLSQSLYPRYSDIDTFHMAACAIDTAIRNAIAAGATLDHLALLDNFCWCSANDPMRLGQLKRAARACYEYTVAYGTPLISGKDSMFNDFKGYDENNDPRVISIPPTLLISSIGVMKDSTKSISLEIKFPGDLIYILGDTYDELGGSEYYAMIGEKLEGKPFIGSNVPQVNARKNKKIYRALSRAIQHEVVSSAISLNVGGLGVALAKSAIGGMLGIDVCLQGLPGEVKRDDTALFSESQGRIVVTINPDHKKEFEKIIKKTSYKLIGTVTNKNVIKITGLQGTSIVHNSIKKTLESYKKTFKHY